MVGYSYVDSDRLQPSMKYHGGQAGRNGNHNQNQLYDLLMSKLLDGTMAGQPHQPQDRVLRHCLQF